MIPARSATARPQKRQRPDRSRSASINRRSYASLRRRTVVESPPEPIRDRIQPYATFDLQIGLPNRSCSEAETVLRQPTQDLAEATKIRIPQHPQFEGALG